MNHFSPSCKILPACLWQRGLAAGVNTFRFIVPDDPFWRFVLIADVILLTLILLGSGCSTNGRYHDGLDHWPVQTISVDSGSN